MATITTINLTDAIADSRTVINNNFSALNTEIATVIHKNGSVAFTVNQPMGGFKLTGLGAGSAAGNSVRYEQVLLLAGGTMTGQINMGSQRIVSQADPTAVQDGATKNYVDTQIAAQAVHNIGAFAYLSSDQLNLVNDTWTKVTLNAELFDLGADFDTTTYKFTCDTAGYYAISGNVNFLTGTVIANKEYGAQIRVNGVTVIMGNIHSELTTALSIALPMKVMHLSVNDYIELWVRSRAGVDTVDLYGTSAANYLSVIIIKAD